MYESIFIKNFQIMNLALYFSFLSFNVYKHLKLEWSFLHFWRPLGTELKPIEGITEKSPRWQCFQCIYQHTSLTCCHLEANNSDEKWLQHGFGGKNIYLHIWFVFNVTLINIPLYTTASRIMVEGSRAWGKHSTIPKLLTDCAMYS